MLRWQSIGPISHNTSLRSYLWMRTLVLQTEQTGSIPVGTTKYFDKQKCVCYSVLVDEENDLLAQLVRAASC